MARCSFDLLGGLEESSAADDASLRFLPPLPSAAAAPSDDDMSRLRGDESAPPDERCLCFSSCVDDAPPLELSSVSSQTFVLPPGETR